MFGEHFYAVHTANFEVFTTTRIDTKHKEPIFQLWANLSI